MKKAQGSCWKSRYLSTSCVLRMFSVSSSKKKKNVFCECQDAKEKIEKLSIKRDEEVGMLRNTLVAKESLFKEMEYKMAHLEVENQDIRASLREFQEAEITNSGTTGSMRKLQRKYQGLEQLHKKCTENFKQKEVEWKSELEKVTRDMDDYLSKLKAQSEQIKQLQDELESSHCLSEIQTEEMSSMIQLVLKSEFSVAYSELFTAVTELEQRNKESEEKIVHLAEQLEMKKNALHELNAKLGLASWTKRPESFNDNTQHQLFLEEELQSHKKMLAELSENQLLLEEQVRLLKNSQKDEKNSADALERENSELAQKILELEKGKSAAENQNIHLIASLEACNTENRSLLCSMNEQNEKNGDLQQQIVLLQMLVREKEESIEALQQEKETYIQIIEDKESNRENQLIASEQEKKSLLQVVEERGQRMVDLEEQIKALEQSIIDAFMSSEEKQKNIDVLAETLHKTQNQAKLEMEEKNGKVIKMEAEISDLYEKLKVKDESLLKSTRQTELLEVLLEKNKLETEKLVDQFGNGKKHLESVVKKLEVQKEALLEDITELSSHREDLLTQMERMCKQIGELSDNDVELMGMLRNILPNPEGENGVPSLPISSLQNHKEEQMIDIRSPLVELNK